MSRFTLRELVHLGVAVSLLGIFLMSWSSIVDFFGLILTAIIPLVLGGAIAYVVSIPLNFLERHMLPNSTSPVVANLRRPLSLLITIVFILWVISFSSSMLIPALVDAVAMVQANGQQFIEDIIRHPLLEPIRPAVQDFLASDLIQNLKNADLSGVMKGVFGGMGSFTTQVFNVVNTIMTGFFGLLFSFILLTDTTDVGNSIMQTLVSYLGERRVERIALVMGTADASFHNFIVRQCMEALILGSVGTAVLTATGYEYALGVGSLMYLAALVPIVGYPIGLFAGAFMVAINNAWIALLYVVVVGIAQVVEATFVLPHVGDPRTVLPPVWVTVAVTIGGGVAGFIGMLVAIPVASTIRQLIIIGGRRRVKKKEQQAAAQE